MPKWDSPQGVAVVVIGALIGLYILRKAFAEINISAGA
jgi:hypothetical protein